MSINLFPLSSIINQLTNIPPQDEIY